MAEIPPSMRLRHACDALREIAAGTAKPHLTALHALEAIDASDQACSGWGPEEESDRRHEQDVERASEDEQRHDERQKMSWMGSS